MEFSVIDNSSLCRTQQTLDQRNVLIEDMKKEIDRQHSQDDMIHKLVCVITTSLNVVESLLEHSCYLYVLLKTDLYICSLLPINLSVNVYVLTLLISVSCAVQLISSTKT